MEAWINGDVFQAGYYDLIVFRGYNNWAFGVFHANRLMFGETGWTGSFSRQIYSDALSWTPSQWYHIAVVYDTAGKTADFYRDGDPVGVGKQSTDELGINNSGIVTISYSNPTGFDGIIDEVRIWDGALTAAQIEYSYANKILHVDDDWDQWPGAYHTITEALDVAVPDDTIIVEAGTYDEQVVINKNLTLQGAGDDTVIKPSVSPLTPTSPIPWLGNTIKAMSAIVSVEATGGTVIIKDLKIDGSLITSKLTLWVGGLVYLETSGKVEGVTVIGNPALPDRTAGIFAAAITNPASLEVTGCTVIGYNRAGIYALGGEFTADYHHNVINGPGSISTGVPNGMFFLEGATGSATENIITDLFYTGEEYRSTGIGTYDAGIGITFGHNTIFNVQNAFALHGGSNVTVEYNTVYNCHTGVRLESGTVDNIIQCNDIRDNTYAIRSSPTGGDNEAHFNNFVGNTGSDIGFPTYVGAVSNVDTTNTLDAIYNWWGSASGPSEVGLGTGDSVSDNVNYDPWSFTPDPCEAKTLGFWKNHEDAVTEILDAYGPLELGEYEVDDSSEVIDMLKSVKANNAYKMLAAQLLAAKLNKLHLVHLGFVALCFDAPIGNADDFLILQTYSGPDMPKPNKVDKAIAIGLKDALDWVNNNGCGECVCEWD